MAIFTSRHKTSGGGTYGALTATQNGDYNAASAGYDGFNDVHVAVPIPTYNSTTLEVTANGVYNAVTAGYDGYSEVNVQVPSGGSNLGTKDIISNGLYNANDYGYDGFSQVNVQVPAGVEVPPLVVNNSSTSTPCYFTESLMNWFNYPVTIPDGVVDVSNMFLEFINFNQPIIIPDSVTNCKFTLAACEFFNSPVTLGNNVVDAYGLFQFDYNFNQPITLPESLVNAGTIFMGCRNFNHPITIPKNVTSIYGLFYGCVNYRPTSFEVPYNVENASRLFENTGIGFNVQNIYIHKNTGTLNVCNMLKSAGRTGVLGRRVNIYCNNLSMVNGTTPGQANSLYNGAVTWTQMTNGYYNDAHKINIYLYNNIFYETDGNLYAKYQGNSTFDAVIRCADSVTNMAYMMNACPNFNSSVKIGNNVTNCRSTLMDCTNFDQPIHIPASVTNARSMLWGCTNFNSPVTFDDALYNIDLRGLLCDTAFNLPITFPNGARNMSSTFQRCYNFNQPLVIPDSVDSDEGIAFILFNANSFNSPITIGNNVKNCHQALECLGLDGVFNQPLIIPNSTTHADYMLYGQRNMKCDIVIGENTSHRQYFLGEADYEGNIYCYNLTYVWWEFLNKTNLSGIVNLYRRDSSGDVYSVVSEHPNIYTNLADTWIHDQVNNLVYSPTANIYIHCNWNGVIPSNNNYSSVVNAIQINSLYYGQDSDKGCQLWVTTGTYDGKSFTANAAPNMVLSYPETTGADGYKDSIISVGQAWATSEWIGTARGNITDGRNNYSAGDGVFVWNMYTAYHSITLWER